MSAKEVRGQAQTKSRAIYDTYNALQQVVARHEIDYSVGLAFVSSSYYIYSERKSHAVVGSRNSEVDSPTDPVLRVTDCNLI